MDYTTWSEENLEQFFITSEGHKTSIWRGKQKAGPLIVMVHGISGDYGGMVPLAAELADNHNVAIVELPGHGGSDTISLPSAHALQTWFDATLEKLEKKLGAVTMICAHSFGCAAVLSEDILKSKKVVLLNPVPEPSGIYITYSQMIMNSAHFWAHIYNWPPLVLLRGRTLSKTRSRDARRRVRWVGWHSKPTYEQIVFQAGLVDIVLDSAAYRYVSSGAVSLVIAAMFDSTARQRDTLDMQEVFGKTEIVFLRGGHLLPIESPDRVARLVEDVVIK